MPILTPAFPCDYDLCGRDRLPYMAKRVIGNVYQQASYGGRQASFSHCPRFLKATHRERSDTRDSGLQSHSQFPEQFVASRARIRLRAQIGQLL